MNGRTNSAVRCLASRKGVLLGVILMVAAFIGAFFYFRSRGNSSPPPPGTAEAAPLQEETAPAPVKKYAASTARGEQVPAVNSPVEQTPDQLMAELEEWSGMGGPVSAEQADKMKQHFEELVRHGAASVPAIRAFLNKNVETYFGEIPGGDQLGYSSLRASLFDTLKRIGGSEAQGAMLEALKTTAVPSELLELAKNLDQAAPGQNRQQILSSANVALSMAASNQLGSNVEVGPAFRAIQNYGAANTIAEVEKNDPANFYSAVAMASLPDAQGLPSLIQMAQNTSGGAQTIATEMIAQMAGQNAEALDALTQMAQKGEIGNSTWMRLAPILGGDQYQIGNSSGQNPGGNAGTSGYSIINGVTTPDQINQRIVLIDKFLGLVPTDSSAAASLQRERGILSGRLGK